MSKQMNKEERSKLVWKYFWGQKWDEIKYFIKILGYACVVFIGIRYIPYFTGLLINKIFPDLFNKFCNNMGNGISCENIFINFWAVGMLPSILIIMLGLGLYLWITENWKLASERAREELE